MRRLFTFFAALSLLMCVAMAGLWVRSYWRADVLHIQHEKYDQRMISSELGWITGTWLYIPVKRDGTPRLMSLVDNRKSREPWFESIPVGKAGKPDWSVRFGFGYRQRKVKYSYVTTTELSQAWLVAAFAILPTLWFIRWRRRRRILPGHCRQCGYDLRESPVRCPECGAKRAEPRAG